MSNLCPINIQETIINLTHWEYTSCIVGIAAIANIKAEITILLQTTLEIIEGILVGIFKYIREKKIAALVYTVYSHHLGQT